MGQKSLPEKKDKVNIGLARDYCRSPTSSFMADAAFNPYFHTLAYICTVRASITSQLPSVASAERSKVPGS